MIPRGDPQYARFMTRLRSTGFSSVGRPRLVGQLGLVGRGRPGEEHQRTTLVPDDSYADEGAFLAADDAPAASRASTLDAAPSPATSIPKLFDGWREATLQSAARARARAVVSADVERALAAAAAEKGAPLTRDEAAVVGAAVYKSKKHDVDGLYQEILAASKKSRHVEDRALREAVRAAEGRVSSRPDPFQEAFAGDGGSALVLWRGAGLVAIVDVGADEPKALVAPRQTVAFPVLVPERDPRPVVPVVSAETGRRLVDDMAQLSAHVGDTLQTAFGGAPEAWINPPAGAAYRRLHAHVVVGGAPIDVRGDAAALRSAFAPVVEVLAQRLGPSST